MCFPLNQAKRPPGSGKSNEVTRTRVHTRKNCPPFDQSISISATGGTGKIYSLSQELLSAEFRNLWPEPPTLRVKDRASFKTDKSFLLLWLRVVLGRTSSLCLSPQPPKQIGKDPRQCLQLGAPGVWIIHPRCPLSINS